MSEQYEKLFDNPEFIKIYKKRFNNHIRAKLIDGELTEESIVSLFTEVVFGVAEGKKINGLAKESTLLDRIMHNSFIMACVEFQNKGRC